METELAQMTAMAQVTRFTGPHREDTHDHLAVEEPLQIRLAGEDVAVTMRTPGHDDELAVGFLFTEGIIAGRHHLESVTYCSDASGSPDNVVNVQPTERGLLEPGAWGARNFYSTSSCGLCGKTSIEQITRRTERLNHTAKVNLQTLYSLSEKLRTAQQGFAQTGGLHAAALFDLDGNLLLVREDVGRHNAVDKVIGHALVNGQLPLDQQILLVSSRASFEIVQKALIAGVSILAVVSAPSSLAVELAREAGMTLVAFLREGRLNMYAGEDELIV